MKKGDEPASPGAHYWRFLVQLLGELMARELTLQIGRYCQWALRERPVGHRFAIPPEFDLCVHLVTSVPATRGSLLFAREDLERLVREARARQTLSVDEGAAPEESLSGLLRPLLVRPVVLLGFLDDRRLSLQGMTVQEVAAESQRKAHEIAFQRQNFAPLDASLEIRDWTAIPGILLLPAELLGRATVRLADPEAVQVTETLFLEHAPLLHQELTTWVETQEEEQMAEAREREEREQAAHRLAEELAAQEEKWARGEVEAWTPEEDPFEEDLFDDDRFAEDPFVLPEADPGLDALDQLLTDLAGELPPDPDDLVLQSPEDLLFAQLFFPGELAHASRNLLGRRIEVRPLEIASLPLARLSEEPAGLMARTLYEGPFSGNTAFVFPHAGLVGLARKTGKRPADLVQILLEPGLQQMQEIQPALRFQILPIRPIDFAALQADEQSLSIRIRYSMEVEGGDSIEFVQYAPTVFVNRLMETLIGQEGLQGLQPNARNMMLSFLDLNALLAASVLEHPQRARSWIGPLLGPEHVPLFRPGETLPDLFDFETLLTLSDRQFDQMRYQLHLGKMTPRAIACAMTYMSPALQGRFFQYMSMGDAERVMANRMDMRLQEVWDARHQFAEQLYHTILCTLADPSPPVQRQARWFMDQLGTQWRVRAEAVLQDTVFFVAGVMEFDRLVDLRDRDLQRVLSMPYLLNDRGLRGGSRVLASAISPADSPVRGKILRNLSENRRQKVAELIREGADPQAVQHNQRIIIQMVYYAALSGDIEVPTSIQRQIDQYLEVMDEQWRYRAHGILQDDTFFEMAAELTLAELRDLQALVKREELLWALQDCDPGTLACFTQGMGVQGRKELTADIGYLPRRVEEADQRVLRSAEARLKIIDAIRLIRLFRAEEG